MRALRSELVNTPASLTELPPTNLHAHHQEGAPRAQCYTPEVLADIARDPLNFKAPGGESQGDVERRVAAFVAEAVMPRLQADGPPAVVVAHGLAIKWCVAVHSLDGTCMRAS